MPSSNKLQAQKMPLGNFAENLRAAIASSGMTQAELAEQTTCTQSDISRYLTKNRIPSGDKLVELAAALRTTAEYLITGKLLAFNSEPASRRSVVTPEVIRLAARASETLIELQDKLKNLA